MATVDQAAQAAYDAYTQAVGGVAFNGDPLPDWETQRIRNPRIADAWRAAALAVAKAATDLVLVTNVDVRPLDLNPEGE